MAIAQKSQAAAVKNKKNTQDVDEESSKSRQKPSRGGDRTASSRARAAAETEEPGQRYRFDIGQRVLVRDGDEGRVPATVVAFDVPDPNKQGVFAP